VAGGSLTVALQADPDDLNPVTGRWGNNTYLVANTIYDPLVAMDDQGIAKPYLAESILPTGDFKAWSIKLRPDVTFQDGEKLDAVAVKKNLDAAKASPLTSQGMGAVSSIDVVDDLTVRVAMSQLWATFPSSLAIQVGYMAAPAMLDDPAGANAAPIGSGPFSFHDRQRDTSLTVQRNAGYWQKDANGQALPYLDSVAFKILSDPSATSAAFQSGDINAYTSIIPSSYAGAKTLAAAGEAQVITNDGQEADEAVLALNTTKPPFNDPIARQALAYGIDQDDLSKVAFNGANPGAWGMFEPGSPYYISPQEAGYPSHDVTKARQHADQYQQAHGEPLAFTIITGTTTDQLTEAQALQAQAGEFGVDVKIESYETNTLISHIVVTGDYQAGVFIVWSSPTPDQGYIFLATKPNPTGLSLNYTRFDDPDLRDAMDQFRAATDPQARIDQMKRVQQALAHNLQVIFLVHDRQAFVYDNDLHGVQTTTFPGTDVPAHVPYVNTPFLTNAWRTKRG
jgi:peptide/nickel transport system substrate-binding protein